MLEPGQSPVSRRQPGSRGGGVRKGTQQKFLVLPAQGRTISGGGSEGGRAWHGAGGKLDSPSQQLCVVTRAANRPVSWDDEAERLQRTEEGP